MTRTIGAAIGVVLVLLFFASLGASVRTRERTGAAAKRRHRTAVVGSGSYSGCYFPGRSSSLRGTSQCASRISNRRCSSFSNFGRSG